MLEAIVTGAVIAGGVAIVGRRIPASSGVFTVNPLRAAAFTDGPDLPCPWCRAATAETDTHCPSCRQPFG